MAPRARGDAADAAWWYARQAGLDAGLRFLDAIDVALSHLSLFPASGSARHAHVAPELGAPLRFVVPAGFERYLIYSLDLHDRVLVVRIWNTARGLDALVDSEAG